MFCEVKTIIFSNLREKAKSLKSFFRPIDFTDTFSFVSFVFERAFETATMKAHQKR
jgi:hypothetical protein